MALGRERIAGRTTDAAMEARGSKHMEEPHQRPTLNGADGAHVVDGQERFRAVLSDDRGVSFRNA